MCRTHVGRLLVGPTPCRWPVVLFVLIATTMGAKGDVFHLKSGGTIEGQLLESDGEEYKIRTGVGIVSVPQDAVERVEEAESPFAEYDRRARDAADTPEGQTALAAWCDQQGLRTEHKRHLLRAIELKPDYAPARRALGYTRVGDLWVEGRTLVARKDGAQATGDRKEEAPERLGRAIQGQWNRRIRAIKQMLESRRERTVEEGRAKILEIKDPLAILPLSEVLSRGNLGCRDLLVEALSAFSEDEATMNLTVIALVDPDAQIRARAVADLVRRADPRVVAQFRAALRSQSDRILRRAAYGLGELRAGAAIPELIDVLTAVRNRWVEVPVRAYLGTMPLVFDGTTVVQLGSGSRAVHHPVVGVGSIGDEIVNEWRYLPVTVYRTEVLEALKSITGENFGFERDQWRRWHEEYR